MTRQAVVVAVSGGVDSVVLLDILVQVNDYDLIVAHFDHGIREASAADADFVRQLAARYGLPFEAKREELGAAASEELARQRRYAFLRQVATRVDARLATAHHQDDLIETVCINLIRGTGWRGLAPMNATVWRPLLDMSKAEVVRYAIEHNLEWREDETNDSLRYLRNRVRSVTGGLPVGVRRQVVELYKAQRILRDNAEQELEQLATNVAQYTDGSWMISRYYVIMLPDVVALELLGYLTLSRLTRPQLQQVLAHSKVARPHKKLYLAGNTVEVEKQSIRIRAS